MHREALAGTFHVEEVIAEGGFGVVYRAQHLSFGEPVAVKVLKLPGTLDTKHSVATGSGGSLFSPGTLINGSPFSGCGTVAVEESTWGSVKAIFRN